MLQSLEVFESTGDGVLVVDADQRVVYWNTAAEKLFGFQAADVLDRKCWRVIAGWDCFGQLHCSPSCRTLTKCRKGQPIISHGLIASTEHGGDIFINVSTLFTSYDDDGESGGEYLVHLFRLADKEPAVKKGLRIRLFGTTTITRTDGSRVKAEFLNRAKVRALLGYFALHPGQRLSRESLVKILWPDLPSVSANHNLTTTVFYLRRCLEPKLERGRESQYILSENAHYLFKDDGVNWLDVRAFEEGVASARREGNPEKAVSAYHRALSLYCGNFQASLTVDNWSWHRNQRTRLRSIYHAGLKELALLHECLGQQVGAMNLYSRLLTLQPWHEMAGRRLMSLHLARGEPQEVIRHYSCLTEALRIELDVPVSEETQNLYERARRAAEIS